MTSQEHPLQRQESQATYAHIFNQGIWDPDLRTTPIHGEAVDINRPMTDGIGLEPWAMLEFPQDATTNSYLALGRHPEKGYFLASSESNTDLLDRSSDQAISLSKLPLEIGSRPGTRITIGREGFTREVPNEAPFRIPAGSPYARKVSKTFGSATSARQAVIEVTIEGVRITDTSSNGTRVQYYPEPSMSE